MIEITLSFGNLAEAQPVLQLLSNYQRDVQPLRPALEKVEADIAANKKEAAQKAQELADIAKNAQKPATTSAPPPATPSSSVPASSPAVASTPPVAAPTAEPSTPTAATSSITYPDLQRAIIRLVAKSPDAMRAICTEFGVKTFAGTPEDVWPKALARVNEEIAKEGA